MTLLQNIEVTGDKEDSRSLHITVHKPASSQHARPVPLLAARFIFDDHIRCMAAKQRLTKGRMKARQQKMQMIERLLDIPAESSSHGTFTRSRPIPGRSHPVRGTSSASERKSGSRSHDQLTGQSESSRGKAPTVSSSDQIQQQHQQSETRVQRSQSIFVEQGTETNTDASQAMIERDNIDDVEEVEEAVEATSEMAFQTLHQTANELAQRHDSSSHENSPIPQEIPLEDMSRKSKSRRKEQLTRAKLTKSRLAAELKLQQDHSRSNSQSPKRKNSAESISKVNLRGRSTSLNSELQEDKNRSRSGTPERRTHSESSPLPSYVSSSTSKHHYRLKKKSREIQTQTAFSSNESVSRLESSTSSSNSAKSDSVVTTMAQPKTLLPAPSPSVSLVQDTDNLDSSITDSPKLMPPVDTDRLRSFSDVSQNSSDNETSARSSTSNRSSESLNLGLDAPTGAGAVLSPAVAKVERLAPGSVETGATATDRLTQLAQIVQQYKFDEENSSEEKTMRSDDKHQDNKS